MAIFGGVGVAIGVAMVLRAGVPIAMRLSKVGADDTIISVIKVSKKTFNKKAKDLLSLFRINTGKNKGNLSERGKEGMNHPAVNQNAATQFAANLATGRGGLTGAQRNILQRYREGTLTRREAVTALGSAGLTASAIPAVIDAIPAGSEIDPRTYFDSRVPRPEDRDAMVRASTGRGEPAPTSAEDIAAAYAEAYGISPRGVAPDFIPLSPLSPGKPYPQGKSLDELAIQRQRQAAERAAITQASPAQTSPRFSTEELAPYQRIAESPVGQKLFGMRRSRPEIERDVTYTQLREQGLVEEANAFLESWNKANKAKLDAALGEFDFPDSPTPTSLTQATQQDKALYTKRYGPPTRETYESAIEEGYISSLAEDIVAAAQDFKNISPQKTRKSKPEEVREDAQPGPFKKGGRVKKVMKKPRKKVMKKMYAKGGSVRKPKKIK